MLTVNYFEMILLLGWRHQNRSDEILAAFPGIELFVHILKELLDLFFGPNIFALIVGYDVEAFAERLFDRIFVVFDFCHDAPQGEL